MQDNKLPITIDAKTPEEAIRRGCYNAGLAPDSLVVTGSSVLPSGLIRFQLGSRSLGELTIDVLIARVDYQFGDVDNRQIIKGYTSEDLEQKGLLAGPEFDEIRRSNFEKRC